MAIKKRRKIKDKKIKVEKSSSSNPPEKAEESKKEKPKEASKKPAKDSKSDMNDTKTKTKPMPENKSKGKKEEKTGLASYIEFLKLTRIEYKKINWPDRRQIVQETWTVLVLVTFITLLVLGYDWVLGNLVFGPLEHWIKINL